MGNRFLLAACMLIAGLFTSCDKDECNNPIRLNDPVYFQYDAYNYAWLLYHAGWFIDKNGDFDYYYQPDTWIEPDSLGYISKDDLLSNFAKADSVIHHVSTNELRPQVALIPNVDESHFSESDHVAADIGVTNLYCYLWDDQKGKYKRLRLATGGDFLQENLDPEALELTSWLKAVGGDSGYFNWK